MHHSGICPYVVWTELLVAGKGEHILNGERLTRVLNLVVDSIFVDPALAESPAQSPVPGALLFGMREQTRKREGHACSAN